MQSNDSIWRGHGKGQAGKNITISLAKVGIQSFPEIGRVEAKYSMAFVISHKQVERAGVLNFLLKQEVNVLQGGRSPVNVISQKNQLVLRFQVPVDNLLCGFEVAMGIANENDFAGLQLYQL
jgi:hypothetical protein